MEQAKKARTHAEMTAATTAKLVSAARRSFGSKGYAETSMDDLCAEVGLTRGALYHHFGGKPGLLEAVVRQIDEEIGDRLEAHYSGIGDPWEAFRACNIEYLRLALEPEIQRIVLRDAPAVLGQRLREIDEDGSIGPLAEALDELMRAGRIADCDAEVMARLLNGALVDAALWIAAGDNSKERFERSARSVELMMKGLER